MFQGLGAAFDLQKWEPMGIKRPKGQIRQLQLLELTAGAVFHDGLDYLAPIRSRLAWYPDAVWRAIMAAQ